MSWQQRHNLKRVELLVYADTLASVDSAATAQGLGRTKWVMLAVAQALGTEPPATDSVAAVAEQSTPDHVPDHTESKPERSMDPDAKLAGLVIESRGKGAQ